VRFAASADEPALFDSDFGGETGMAKKRPSSAADYAEVVIERKGQPTLKGEMWVEGGSLTVTSSDGFRRIGVDVFEIPEPGRIFQISER